MKVVGKEEEIIIFVLIKPFALQHMHHGSVENVLSLWMCILTGVAAPAQHGFSALLF